MYNFLLVNRNNNIILLQMVARISVRQIVLLVNSLKVYISLQNNYYWYILWIPHLN